MPSVNTIKNRLMTLKHPLDSTYSIDINPVNMNYDIGRRTCSQEYSLK